MATASLLLVADYKNRALISAMGSRLPASTPQFVQGDNVAVEIHLVTVSSSFSNPTPETAIPETAAVYIAVGIPGSTPVAQASLTTALANNLGRTGSLSLNTAEVASLLGSSASADATFEGEMTEADGTVTTLFRVPCKVLNDLIEAGGAAPAAVPSIVADIADMRGDLDALRGGVPLTGWANSTAYPFGTCTITGGIPSALEFAGSTDDFAYAELALTDFAPDTLDISGTVSAGTVELADLSLVFLDGAGTEAGTIGALTLGAAFSFASVVVPYGAVKVAVKALGTAATSSLSTGFTALSVTAHATLSELTADALAAILAEKAQAQADAGTIAALVPGAQLDAEAAATARETAQVSAIDAAAAELAAETSATNAAAHELAAYNAMMAAGNSNKVATDDWRLGLRGGVWTTNNNASTTGGLTPVSPVSGWACLSLNWLSRNHVAQTTTQAFTGAAYLAGVHFGFYAYITTAGYIGIYYEVGGGAVQAGIHLPPSGWQWLHLVWNATTRTFSFFYDNAAVAAATVVIPGTLPCGPLLKIMAGWTPASNYAALGHIRTACVLNFVPTDAQRAAVMRGEYQQAWVGGATTSAAFAGAWTDSNLTSGGGTITVNAGGTLSASCSAATADNAINATLAAAPQPLLRPGRVVRLRYSLTVNSGSAPTIKIQQGNVVSGLVALLAGASSLTDVAVTLEGFAAGTNIKLRIQTGGASNFTLSNVSVEILGAQVLVGPSDWTRTRGVDMSGNCNDLVYGTGVVAIEPATKARVVQATAAGATVSAGAVATVGTLSGATYRDAKALAALRQWDAVSANWRQARPANCAALQAAVTADGTPLVEATAITGNAVVAANAALNIIHHIN